MRTMNDDRQYNHERRDADFEEKEAREDALPPKSRCSGLKRRVETMPDGRYIIYYSWEEDEG